MKKKYLLIIIICLLVIIGVSIYTVSKINKVTISSKNISEPIELADEIIENNPNAKKVNNQEECIYKHFSPSFENGYDYTDDMEYQGKVYYKKIENYDDYLVVRERWNDIIDISKEDFNNYFMIITAVENTSMADTTIANIYVDEDTLYINFDENPENGEYIYDKPCISILIPTNMNRETIKIADIRNKEKSPEEKYGWTNNPTDGLDEISKDEAIDTAIKYAKELKTSGSYMGKYLDNYTKVYEVKKTTYHPNNYWLIEEGIVERNLETASFTRDVYEVTLVSTDDEMEVNRAYFYIDLYTGEVIAGREASD